MMIFPSHGESGPLPSVVFLNRVGFFLHDDPESTAQIIAVDLPGHSTNDYRRAAAVVSLRHDAAHGKAEGPTAGIFSQIVTRIFQDEDAGKPFQPSNTLPPELVLGIEMMSVIFRHGGDDGPRVIVSMSDVPPFVHDGESETAALLIDRFPELSLSACKRAARMISAQCRRHAPKPEMARPRRKNWVHDW